MSCVVRRTGALVYVLATGCSTPSNEGVHAPRSAVTTPAAPSAAPAAAPAPTPAHTQAPVVHPTLWLDLGGAVTDASFARSGHVIVRSRTDVALWDVDTGRAYVRVSARPATDAAKTATLTLRGVSGSSKPLATVRVASDPIEQVLDLSADERWLVHVGSKRALNRAGTLEDTRVCVYSIADQSPAHCTKVPPLVEQAHGGSAELSPDGEFFVYDNIFVDTQVHDAATGRKLVSFRSSYQSNRMGRQHYFFAGARRLVVLADDGVTLRVMDLPSAAVVASQRYDAGYTFEAGHVPAPDSARLATVLVKGAERAVGVWKLENGSAAVYPVPASVCAAAAPCSAGWSTATRLVVRGEGSNESLQIDTDSGALGRLPAQGLPALPGALDPSGRRRLFQRDELVVVVDVDGSEHSFGSRPLP